MKVFILLNLLVLSSAFDQKLNQWSYFKEVFNKSYPSIEYENEAFTYYLRNMKFIKEHNDKYNKGEFSYSLAPNQFIDLSPEKIKRTSHGYKFRQSYNGTVLMKKGNLPESVDWRIKGIVGPIKRQGTCGSCWTFSAVAAMEGFHAHKTGKFVQLSEQNLIDCAVYGDNCGCFGGNMDGAFRYVISNNGIATEDSYPYEGKVKRCRFKNSTIGARISNYRKIQRLDERSLQVASSMGIVSVGIEVLKKFEFYKHGIFDEPCSDSPEITHAVAIVGYGSANNTDYWIIKNSWGTDWGEKGYMRVLRGNNSICITEDAFLLFH